MSSHQVLFHLTVLNFPDQEITRLCIHFVLGHLITLIVVKTTIPQNSFFFPSHIYTQLLKTNPPLLPTARRHVASSFSSLLTFPATLSPWKQGWEQTANRLPYNGKLPHFSGSSLLLPSRPVQPQYHLEEMALCKSAVTATHFIMLCLIMLILTLWSHFAFSLSSSLLPTLFCAASKRLLLNWGTRTQLWNRTN